MRILIIDDEPDLLDQLSQVLADSITLRDMYQQYRWQAAGSTFYQLHLLFARHHEAQAKIVDAIAERIQLLGGLAEGLGARSK